MTSKQAVDEFLAQEALAIVGVSRSGKKFGNAALRELRANGYRVYPVHPVAQAVEGLTCSRSLAGLPEKVGGVLIVVPPGRTEAVVQEAAAAGIQRVWMQQGSASPEALAACAAHGLTAVHGECVLMFLREGPFFHRLHRWIRKVRGTLPV